MPTISAVSLRPARLFGLMTPVAVVIGVALLLMLPNLMTDANSDGDHAVSESVDAAVASPPIMR